jgi:hypothetical protein
MSKFLAICVSVLTLASTFALQADEPIASKVKPTLVASETPKTDTGEKPRCT